MDAKSELIMRRSDEELAQRAMFQVAAMLEDAFRGGWSDGRLGQVNESVNMSGELAREYARGYALGEAALKESRS